MAVPIDFCEPDYTSGGKKALHISMQG